MTSKKAAVKISLHDIKHRKAYFVSETCYFHDFHVPRPPVGRVSECSSSKDFLQVLGTVDEAKSLSLKIIYTDIIQFPRKCKSLDTHITEHSRYAGPDYTNFSLKGPGFY